MPTTQAFSSKIIHVNFIHIIVFHFLSSSAKIRLHLRTSYLNFLGTWSETGKTFTSTLIYQAKPKSGAQSFNLFLIICQNRWACDPMENLTWSAVKMAISTPEPTILSCDSCQLISCFDSRHLTIIWMSSIKVKSLHCSQRTTCIVYVWAPSPYWGDVVRRADAPAKHVKNHDDHKKMHDFPIFILMGLRSRGPWDRQSSAIKTVSRDKII